MAPTVLIWLPNVVANTLVAPGHPIAAQCVRLCHKNSSGAAQGICQGAYILQRSQTANSPSRKRMWPSMDVAVQHSGHQRRFSPNKTIAWCEASTSYPPNLVKVWVYWFQNVCKMFIIFQMTLVSKMHTFLKGNEQKYLLKCRVKSLSGLA